MRSSLQEKNLLAKEQICKQLFTSFHMVDGDCCCCCVLVLRPRKTSKVMSGRSVNLITLPGHV